MPQPLENARHSRPSANPKARRWAWAICLAATMGVAAAAPPKRHPTKPTPAETYRANPEAMAWADTAAREQGWDPAAVRALLGQAVRQASVIRLVKPATQAPSKNWAVYRARFVEPKRIAAGLAFWQQHEATLQRAEQVYGVPPWLVVGIIGVETLYGRHTGQYRALDALATLAFDFPDEHPRAAQRRAFFQGELLAFLQLVRTTNTPAERWLGSYAGALGLPQFMPSSWQRHAVDFDGDGRIDLQGSAADAIGSVARYMRAHGWVPGVDTHQAIELDGQVRDLDTLLQPDILPTWSVDRLLSQGVPVKGEHMAQAGPLALVKLENGGAAPTYVVGTGNFYTVTRYNWSSYYALAVIELGQAIAQQRR